MKQSPFFHTVLIIAFLFNTLGPIPNARAKEMSTLPAAGQRLSLSQAFIPAQMRGITIDPKNPLRFEFLIQRGDQPVTGQVQRDEYQNLVKYFLAALTTPEDNLWVNLSPYEKNRIIADDFGKTEMGRDLLAQDYILKQLTASLIYPEDGLGKEFWDKVYKAAYDQFGNTNIPVNTFNKVWIIPDNASIYTQGNSAYIVKSHLKVMLEEDYLSMGKNARNDRGTNAIGSQAVREIILPAIEREVNEGKSFAALRQIYSAMILAEWYKRTIKNSLLSKVYVNKAKTVGIDYKNSVMAGIVSPAARNDGHIVRNDVELIYQQYLQAFKKGVYNYIKEDYDRYTKETIPRKYFSGGFKAGKIEFSNAIHSEPSRDVAAQALTPAMNAGMDRAEIALAPENSPNVLEGFEKEEKEVLGRFLVHNVFRPINETIAQRTSLSGQVTTPFIFPQHDFLLDDDPVGGVGMFGLLNQLMMEMLKNPRFKEKWEDVLVSPSDKAEDLRPQDLEPIIAMLKVQESLQSEHKEEEVMETHRKLLKSLRTLLSNRGFDPGTDLVLDQVIQFIDSEQGRKQEGQVWSPADMNRLLRIMKRLGIQLKEMPIENRVSLLIGFLDKGGLIQGQEKEDLENHWRGLNRILTQLKALPQATDGSADGHDRRTIHTGKEALKKVLAAQAGVPVEEFSMDPMMLEYHAHTKAIYTILTGSFLRFGQEIEEAKYEEVDLPESDVQLKGVKVEQLRHGFYQDAMGYLGYLPPPQAGEAPRKIIRRIQVNSKNEKELADIFKSSPPVMMDVFLLAAQAQALPSVQVLSAMRSALADRSIQWKDQRAKLEKGFKRILRTKQNVSLVLLCMYEVGLLAKVRNDLASRDTIFDEYFHRYPITQHTLYLLYVLEYGIDDLRSQIENNPALNEAQRLYQSLTSSTNNRTRLLFILREAILRHDSQKPFSPEEGQVTHALAAAQDTHTAFMTRADLAEVWQSVEWLTWNHGLLSSLAKGAAEDRYQQSPYASDFILLHNLTKEKEGKEGKEVTGVNRQILELLFLLTFADTNAVDPTKSQSRLNNRENMFKFQLYSQVAAFLKDKPNQGAILKAWEAQAKQERGVLEQRALASVTTGLDTICQKQEGRVEEIRALLGVGTEASIGALIAYLRDPKEGPARVNDWFKEYTSLFPIQYLRSLNERQIVVQFLMFAYLSQESTNRDVSVAHVGKYSGSDGPMFDIVAGVGRDRELVLNRYTGLLAALGFNIMYPYIYTSNTTHVVFDRFTGYFTDPQPQEHLKRLWPQLEGVLKKYGVEIPAEVSVTWEIALPVLLRAVQEHEGFLQDILNLEGAVKSFKKINPDSTLPSEVTVTRDGDSSHYTVDFTTDDRLGMFYVLTSVLGEGLRANITVERPEDITRALLNVTDRIKISVRKELTGHELEAIQETLKALLNKVEISDEELRGVVARFKRGEYALPSQAMATLDTAMNAQQEAIMNLEKADVLLAGRLKDKLETIFHLRNGIELHPSTAIKPNVFYTANVRRFILETVNEYLKLSGIAIDARGIDVSMDGNKEITMEIQLLDGKRLVAPIIDVLKERNRFYYASLEGVILAIARQQAQQQKIVLAVDRSFQEVLGDLQASVKEALDIVNPRLNELKPVVDGEVKGIYREDFVKPLASIARNISFEVKRLSAYGSAPAAKALAGIFVDGLIFDVTKVLMWNKEKGDFIEVPSGDGKSACVVDALMTIATWDSPESIHLDVATQRTDLERSVRVLTNIKQFLDRLQSTPAIPAALADFYVGKDKSETRQRFLRTVSEVFASAARIKTDLSGHNGQQLDFVDATPGGIDLNGKSLAMTVESADKNRPLEFQFDPAQFANISGFTAVVVSITPVTRLPFLD